MRQTPVVRQASILFYCIGLITVMVALAFSFLASVRAMDDAATSSQRQWLAQDAARQGLDTALEQIVADYANPAVPVTHLDGSWSRWARPLAPDFNQPGCEDDVRSENPLIFPLQGLVDQRDDQRLRAQDSGAFYGYDGRGRYFEPGWGMGATAPVFTNQTGPTPALAGGLWFDQRLRRIVPTSGESADDVRRRARFRLRFAVSMEDLSGHLLINPVADTRGSFGDYRDLWRPGQAAVTSQAIPGSLYAADAEYTTYGAVFAPTREGQRIERNRHALFNMIASGPNMNAARPDAARIEHIFQLRGMTSNVALGVRGGPVAFPSMLRQQRGAASNKNFHSVENAPDERGRTLYPNQDGVARFEGGQAIARGTATNNYSSAFGGQAGYFAQDDPITPVSSFTHALTGPQFSWRNLQSAVMGHGADHLNYDRYWWPNGFNPEQQRFWLTPFGRGATEERSGASTPSHFGAASPTDTPWIVNALTAPPATVHAMVVGYLPPPMKWLWITRREYYRVRKDPAAPNDETRWVSELAAVRTGSDAAIIRGRSLQNDYLSSAFRRWPALTARCVDAGGTETGPLIWPNFWRKDLDDRRPAAEVYPGRLAVLKQTSGGAPETMVDTAREECPDDVGQLIDTSEQPYGRCTRTGQDLVHLTIPGARVRRGGSGSTPLWIGGSLPINTSWQNGGLSTWDPAVLQPNDQTLWPIWGFSPDDYVVMTLDADRFPYLVKSYWWDLIKGFSQALAVQRAHWVDATNDQMSLEVGAGNAFPNGRLTETLVDGIDDLDRLFLAQLGEDVGNPGSGAPIAGWRLSQGVSGQVFAQGGYTATNTIRSLVTSDRLLVTNVPTVTSVRRARVMELIINDFRLSLLGSSPDYWQVFQPLDLDRDGFAVCSGYHNEITFAEGDRWPASAAANGRGPQPDVFFSLTGCFTTKKSHFYRVFSRGELWDELLASPVASATTEQVIGIDLDNDVIRAPNSQVAPRKLMEDTQVLHQRWYWNRYNGQLPAVYP